LVILQFRFKGSVQAGREDVQRKGDDLLRSLGPTIRDRSAKGRGAAIIVHEIAPAAYPWQVVRIELGQRNFDAGYPNKNMDAVSRVPGSRWMLQKKCRRIAGRISTRSRKLPSEDFGRDAIQSWYPIKQQIASFNRTTS